MRPAEVTTMIPPRSWFSRLSPRWRLRSARGTTHAMTMLLANLQRTADTRRAAPTSMIAPMIVWVVETGMPSHVAANNVSARPVSAQKPCIGLSLVILEPIVCNEAG